MNPDEFVLLNQSGPPITFSGSFPANPYAGQTGLAPKYPLVDSLPATVVDGQSWRVGSSDSACVEVLGRNVVSLTGAGVSSFLPVVDSYKNPAKTQFYFRDVTAGAPATGSRVIFSFSGKIVGYVLSSGRLWIDVDSTVGYETSREVPTVNICDGLWHLISIEFTTTSIIVKVDAYSNTVNTSGYSSPNIALVTISSKNDVDPLQVCNIQQSLNGVLIDNIPCTESTGTSLANTTSPSRPATLSDANAHALSWVPQPTVTNTVWQWQPPEWVDLIP